MSFSSSGAGNSPIYTSSSMYNSQINEDPGVAADQQSNDGKDPLGVQATKSRASILYEALFLSDTSSVDNSIHTQYRRRQSVPDTVAHNWPETSQQTLPGQEQLNKTRSSIATITPSGSSDSVAISFTSSNSSLPEHCAMGSADEGVNWKSSLSDLRRSQLERATNSDTRSSHPYSYRRAQIPMAGVLPSLSQQGTFESLSAECFEAAISENLRKNPQFKDKFVTKLKSSKYLPYLSRNSKSHSKSLHGYHHHHHNHQQQSEEQQQEHNKDEAHLQATDSKLALQVTIATVTTTFTNFSTPNIPSRPSSRSSSQSSASSEKFSSLNTNCSKKLRYNQTALALQNSGLMKTTVKTAELLRKSRLLQQELAKLRKETSLLVQSVLNNPQNKLAKELYLKDNGNLNPS